MTHSGLQFFLMHWFQKRKANKTSVSRENLTTTTTNKVLLNQQTNQQQQGSIFTFPNTTSRERYKVSRDDQIFFNFLNLFYSENP